MASWAYTSPNILQKKDGKASSYLETLLLLKKTSDLWNILQSEKKQFSILENHRFEHRVHYNKEAQLFSSYQNKASFIDRDYYLKLQAKHKIANYDRMKILSAELADNLLKDVSIEDTAATPFRK